METELILLTRQINEKYICIFCIFYWKQNHCSLYSLYLILNSQHYFFFFVIQRCQFAICIQYLNCCVFLWEYWSVSQKLISILNETNLSGIQLNLYIMFLIDVRLNSKFMSNQCFFSDNCCRFNFTSQLIRSEFHLELMGLLILVRWASLVLYHFVCSSFMNNPFHSFLFNRSKFQKFQNFKNSEFQKFQNFKNFRTSKISEFQKVEKF